MRKNFASLAVVFLGLMAGALAEGSPSICDSVPGNVVTNCGFETGDFTGWTLSGNLEGGIGGNDIYVDNSNPNSGTYDAALGVQGGGGSSLGTLGPFLTLSQTLTLTGGFYYNVSFYLEQAGCSPGLPQTDPTSCGPGFVNYFDAKWDGNTYFHELNAPEDLAYNQYSFSVGVGPSGSYRLSFDSQNDADYWYVDDIIVTQGSPVPEPASWLLVAPALVAGLFLRARRRRRAA